MVPTKIIGEQTCGLVKSGARVLEVFELFYEARRPLRAVDIGSALHFPKSSTVELLKTLVETGYLSFDTDAKTYFPSFRMVRFGSWLSDHYYDGNRVNDLMRHLNEETGLATALSMQNGRRMQFLVILRASETETLQAEAEYVSEGLKMPIIGSAAGSALLMTKPEHTIAAIYAGAMGLRSECIPRLELDYILGLVRKFKRRGYATNFRAVVPEVSSVAMPLPCRPGRPQLILGCGAPTREWSAERERDLAEVLGAAIRRFMG